MKLRCIDNCNSEGSLTKGKIYEGVKGVSAIIGPYYAVTDDKGRTSQRYFEYRFEIVHEQAEVVIAHPYTVLVWTKDGGFRPCGAVYKTADAVFQAINNVIDMGVPTYIYTPSGCMYTPKAIKTLGLNLWKEVNKE